MVQPTGTDTTYKELKLMTNVRQRVKSDSTDTTYKELKPINTMNTF